MLINLADFLAGWAGGVLSLLVSYPFDTVKVKQQTYHSTLIKTLTSTYKYQGISGFYRGIFIPMLTYGPSNSLFFGVYGNAMRLLGHSDAINHSISSKDINAVTRVFVSGTIAGSIQTVIYSPIEYVKILLQANTEVNVCWNRKYVPPYKTTYQAVVGIYRTSGFFGYYRGFFPMFIRDAPTGGIYILTYEILRHSTLRDINFLNHIAKEIIAGGTAGLASIACVIPVDVVKTHIQTDDPQNPYFKGTIDCCRKLYASNGIRIFFKGLPAICIRAFPAHAVMFVGYEFIMSFF